jgi:hypothetical protein
VLLRALRRLASICLNEVTERSQLGLFWSFGPRLRGGRPSLVLLTIEVGSSMRVSGVFAAIARGKKRSDRRQLFPTMQLHRQSDEPRDGVPGTAAR